MRLALLDSVSRHSGTEYRSVTAIPNLDLYRQQTPTQPEECLVEPTLALVVQGAKRMVQGGEPHVYGVHRFLVTSLDLPASIQVIEASDDKPYLGMALKLNLRVLTEMMAQVTPRQKEQPLARGVVVGEMTEFLYDAFWRLVALLDDPDAIPVLAPLTEREIYYRLLMSDQGSRLRQIASVGTQSNRVARAIEWLLRNYQQPIRVEALADRVQMGASTFHHHFRQLTGISPLQYQKWIRLNEARRLMLSENLDAAAASYRVGYESPTQFNREYSRQFGQTPRRDVEALRKRPDFSLSVNSRSASL